GYDSCAAAAIKASMLEPRPEMRIATRFLAIAGWYVGFLGRATLAASITAPLAPTLSPQAGRGRKGRLGKARRPVYPAPSARGVRLEYPQPHHARPHSVRADHGLGHQLGRDAVRVRAVRPRRAERRRRRLSRQAPRHGDRAWRLSRSDRRQG